jgi:hypothetical protein
MPKRSQRPTTPAPLQAATVSVAEYSYQTPLPNFRYAATAIAITAGAGKAMTLPFLRLAFTFACLIAPRRRCPSTSLLQHRRNRDRPIKNAVLTLGTLREILENPKATALMVDLTGVEPVSDTELQRFI